MAEDMASEKLTNAACDELEALRRRRMLRK